MNKTTLLIPALLCTGMSMYSHANLNGCIDTTDSEKKTAVYFANGILTKKFDASFMAKTMKNAYKSQFESLHENSSYVFSDAYNYSQGALTDITQVLQQKMDEEGVDGITGYQIYDLISSKLNNDAIRATLAVYLTPNTLALFTDSLLEELGESMIQASIDAIADRITVNSEHVGLYEADLLAGKRVIIVPHSQGNLFTNSAVASVKTRQPERADSIDYFGIANPSAFTVDGAQYVTADDDRVIDSLRLIENVLPSNIDNDPSILPGFLGGDFRSISNHLIIEDYFDARLASRGVIDTNLTRLAQDTPFPTQIAGTGAIRASLSWGDQSDIDLHAFEPNGSHVYYQDFTGQDGTLDVDDINGQGPENYVVACENVNTGTYQIGVNYYSGSAPETARVAIFLGDGRTVTPRELLLNKAEGPNGDDSPAVVFEITVSNDGNGNAVYSVQ
ncbi:hypothetical protein PCIT_a3386 [Pseudoalteromonas citrea]|uniref:DUF2135 domain-containing protein n=2 Tax=Pseudoalteromonas citrea TaxID=43655 RepID=A0AAD4FR32_9GAMM|nr:DUF2135 domain-containing protein [Pseudoalteromonas citrea]KAF7768869.1 hypothetical protein PCIT_a3386 [Pseudoalteromonas citrea]